MRYWVYDRPEVSTVARAAALAEEFVTHLAREVSNGRKSDLNFRFGWPKQGPEKRKNDPVIDGT